MKRCPDCGFGGLLSAFVDEELRVGNRRFVRKLPAQRCQKCGADYTAASDLDSLELAAASEIIKSGESSGANFRFLRTLLGMRAQELASLLGVAPENLSKWENGHTQRIPQTAWAALAEMVLEKHGRHPGMRELLERAASRKPLPKLVKLAVTGA